MPVPSPSVPLGSALTVEVLSNPSRIAALEKFRLAGPVPATAQPRFFLASVVQRQWIPRAVVVRRGGEIQGVAYFKERKFGLRTGILYADFSLTGCVAAEPGEQEIVLRTALAHLLDSNSVRGLRLRLPQHGFEVAAVESVARSRGARVMVVEDSYHLILNLYDSYDEFLKSVGYKTRRNLRYYRRRFEAGGHRYIPQMQFGVFERVAQSLGTRPVVGASDEGMTRALSMMGAVSRPLLAGLQRADGEWVAIIGGWMEADLPIVFFQMNNDRDYSSDSLCTVLRGYFFETLIQQGYPKVAFWGGTGDPFRQVAIPRPAVSTFVDVRARSWRAVQSLLQFASPCLPASFREMVAWVAPTAKQ